MAKIVQGDRHIAVHFEALDLAPFPLTDCPERGENVPNTLARRGLHELITLDEAAKAIAVDTTLTLEGKAAALAPLVTRAAARIKERQSELAPVHAEAKQATDRLYAIPKLDPGDVVSRLDDQERREKLAKWAGPKRTERLNELHLPENEKYLLAVLRDPNDSDERDKIALPRWRERIEASRPKEAEAVKTRNDAADWAAEGLARAAAAAGPRLTLRGSR